MNLSPRWDCVVLTHDLDFGGILAATAGEKPSVVQIRAENLNPAVIGPTVLRALVQTETQLGTGALVTIDPGRARVTLLPLPSASA
jgi:predicted nuclease of predicted toxin-antitoxin system